MSKRQEKNNEKSLDSNNESDEESLEGKIDSVIDEEGVSISKEEKDKIKKRIQKEIQSIAVQKESYFSGPLPPPKILNDYNKVLEGGANRVFSMTEKQVNHRIETEAKSINKELKLNGRGQTFAFILAMVIILAATFLGYVGQTTLPVFMSTTTVVSLAVIFVLKREPSKSSKKTEEPKEESE